MIQITITGPKAAGKTTLQEIIASALNELGLNVVSRKDECAFRAYPPRPLRHWLDQKNTLDDRPIRLAVDESNGAEFVAMQVPKALWGKDRTGTVRVARIVEESLELFDVVGDAAPFLMLLLKHAETVGLGQSEVDRLQVLCRRALDCICEIDGGDS